MSGNVTWDTTIYLTVTITCTSCKKKIREDRYISEADYAERGPAVLSGMRESTAERSDARGWHNGICGTCRDKA